MRIFTEEGDAIPRQRSRFRQSGKVHTLRACTAFRRHDQEVQRAAGQVALDLSLDQFEISQAMIQLVIVC